MPKAFVYKTSAVNGITIHWAETGTAGQRPPLLMLHGLSDTHRTWTPLAHELGRDRLVIMPDLPGHGLSDRPDACYSLTWYADVMAQWMAVAGLDEVDVLGHSFGGGVAQMLLLACPQRIRRLALLSSGGLGREIAFILRLASVPFVVEHLGQPFMALGTKLALALARDGRTGEDIAALAATARQKGSAMAFARTVRQLINWRGQRYTCYQRMHEIRALPPIRTFWGSRDDIIPSSHGKDLADALEHARLVILEGCGHYPHFEDPRRLMIALREFFDSLYVPPARLKTA